MSYCSCVVCLNDTLYTVVLLLYCPLNRLHCMGGKSRFFTPSGWTKSVYSLCQCFTSSNRRHLSKITRLTEHTSKIWYNHKFRCTYLWKFVRFVLCPPSSTHVNSRSDTPNTTTTHPLITVVVFPLRRRPLLLDFLTFIPVIKDSKTRNKVRIDS